MLTKPILGSSLYYIITYYITTVGQLLSHLSLNFFPIRSISKGNVLLDLTFTSNPKFQSRHFLPIQDSSRSSRPCSTHSINGMLSDRSPRNKLKIKKCTYLKRMQYYASLFFKFWNYRNMKKTITYILYILY